MATNLRLDWATHEAAAYACKNWHYSKCTPKSKQVRVGVWEDGRFIGVVMIGNSSGHSLFNFLGLNQFTGAELTRIALKEHKTPVSRIVSIAVKMVRKENPKLKALVSFADPNVGHAGGIYQAGNWKYFGLGSKQRQYYFRGKWRNDMKLMQFFKGRRGQMRQLKQKELLPKHKYVLFFCKDLENKMSSHFKDYPKRAVSIDNDAAPNQVAEGGVNPTTALQKK